MSYPGLGGEPRGPEFVSPGINDRPPGVPLPEHARQSRLLKLDAPNPNGFRMMLPGAFIGARQSLQRGPEGIQPTSFFVRSSPRACPVSTACQSSVSSSSASCWRPSDLGSVIAAF